MTPENGDACLQIHDDEEAMETETAIREGIEAAERGEMKDAEQVYADMKTRFGISD